MKIWWSAKTERDVYKRHEAPEGSVSKVIYPVAELKETKNKDAADAFMEFLQSDEALDVFKVAGFTVNSQQ